MSAGVACDAPVRITLARIMPAHAAHQTATEPRSGHQPRPRRHPRLPAAATRSRPRGPPGIRRSQDSTLRGGPPSAPAHPHQAPQRKVNLTPLFMERHWPAVARGEVAAPPAIREWAVKLETKPK